MAAFGQDLGVPAAVVGPVVDEQWRARWSGGLRAARLSRMAAGAGDDLWRERRPLVVDLSSLWAGPLCGHLLTQAGARVIKVESLGRPDAARFGPQAFFDRLHADQEMVQLDFSTTQGRAQLSRLIARADVVIEASRPRALEQLGVDLTAVFAARPGVTWVSLTAYGRKGPWRNRVGFGDDAAAAGGLVEWDDAGGPVFVGDALADPIAGLMAAAGAFAAMAAGGGLLVDVALREAAAFIAGAPPIVTRDWTQGAQPAPPLARPPAERPARPAGLDTAAVLAELG
jgi:crotonobetainyl-CoA:carnitine CoA-transferase CaiB-like acyl-CoA transferase